MTRFARRLSIPWIAVIVVCAVGVGFVWWAFDEVWGDDAPGGRRDTIWINALNGDPAPISMSLSEEEQNLVLWANLSGTCQAEYVRTVLENLDVALSKTQPIGDDALPSNARRDEAVVQVDPDRLVVPIELAILNPSCDSEVLVDLAQADPCGCPALEDAAGSDEKAELALLEAQTADYCR